MTEEIRQKIIKIQNGDKIVLNQIIEENQGLIWSIVRRFDNRGYEIEDLYQIGCIGFIKALKRFDTSLDYKISTFAVPYILGEIKRFLRDDGMVKVSRSIKELGIKIKDIENKYLIETGKQITIKEIAKKLKVPEEDVYLAVDSSKKVESLNDEKFLDSKKEKIDCISKEENFQEKVVNKILLKELLDGLKNRDKQIIDLRYFKDKTQTQVASILGISQVQVSRIEKKILINMRKGFIADVV